MAKGFLIFASELKALKLDADIPQQVNPAAVAQFLSLNYVLSSQCILSGVRKLAPAQYLLIEQDRSAAPVCYWDLAAHFKNKQNIVDEDAAAVR